MSHSLIFRKDVTLDQHVSFGNRLGVGQSSLARSELSPRRSMNTISWIRWPRTRNLWPKSSRRPILGADSTLENEMTQDEAADLAEDAEVEEVDPEEVTSVTKEGIEEAIRIAEGDPPARKGEGTTGALRRIVLKCKVTGRRTVFILQTLPSSEFATHLGLSLDTSSLPFSTASSLVSLPRSRFGVITMADSDAQPTLQPTPTEDDLLAKLDALELVGQQSAPIPLVRSTSDHRQPIPSTSDTSPSPETESWSSPSTFPLTPTSALSSSQQPPVISPPPPSRRTLVLFQEACAKHRYTRDGNVSTIVERPERIRAVKTGVAAAWARLEARNIAHGGVKWSGAPGPASKDEDAELEALMKGMGLAETGDGKGKAREVLGGPFDILLSTAVLPVDDPALHFIHPLPNLPPTPPLASRQAPPPAPAAPSPLPSSSRTLRTPSASPAKPSAASLPPSTAAPLLDAAHRLTSSNPFPPWPQQLSTLCKNASQAILSPPFSEIPPHLPQGDLYLTEGSEEAIFGALGAVC